MDDNNRDDALYAANQVNDNVKVVKALVRKDDVWVVAEFLIDQTPDFEDLIPRMMKILKGARLNFYDTIRNL